MSPRRSPTRCPRKSPRMSPRRSPTRCPRRSPRMSLRRSPTRCPRKSPRMSPRRRGALGGALDAFMLLVAFASSVELAS